MTIPNENIQNSNDQQKQNDKEYNFSQLRKQAESERQARLQAEQRVAELERLASSRKNDEEDDDEPYVDKRRLSKTLASFEQNMEKKIEEKAEQKARMLMDEEKKNSYLRENHDFNQTMVEQNVQKFAERHPKLAESILRMPEGFERQKLVYENIKALGVDRPDAKQPSIQEKIDANKKSPYYQPSGSSGPGYSNGGDFSPASQKNNYEKMMELKSRMRLG